MIEARAVASLSSSPCFLLQLPNNPAARVRNDLQRSPVELLLLAQALGMFADLSRHVPE